MYRTAVKSNTYVNWILESQSFVWLNNISTTKPSKYRSRMMVKNFQILTPFPTNRSSLFSCPAILTFDFLSVWLSLFLSVWLTACLTDWLPVCLSDVHSLCLSDCLSQCLSDCLSVCLSVSLADFLTSWWRSEQLLFLITMLKSKKKIQYVWGGHGDLYGCRAVKKGLPVRHRGIQGTFCVFPRGLRLTRQLHDYNDFFIHLMLFIITNTASKSVSQYLLITIHRITWYYKNNIII